jgi:hypothetical protein
MTLLGLVGLVAVLSASTPCPASVKHFEFLAHHDLDHQDLTNAKTTNIDELKIMCESHSTPAFYSNSNDKPLLA